MCAIFGLIDYKKVFSAAQRECFINVLAKECEIRGTDATGFAFNSHGKLRIFKRPVAAHELSLRLSENANVILGHTRMATQGDKKFNCNNHPFYGHVRGTKFALAHNGIIYNDNKLRKDLGISESYIETDSYVAVQMIEKSGKLGKKNLAKMAEKINGPFVFTVLDESNNSYFVRGDNPLALYHFKDGFYVYASTDMILESALIELGLNDLPFEEIESVCGDILKIDSGGNLTRSTFQPSAYPNYPYDYIWQDNFLYGLNRLNRLAERNGIGEDCIDLLLDYGYTIEEVEDLCCIPYAVQTAVEDILSEFGYCEN